jgi:hypothetical protein
MLLVRHGGFLPLCLCFGCTGILGLDDLSYDRDPAAEIQHPSAGSEDAGTVADAGHLSSVDATTDSLANPEVQDLPVLWRPSQVLVEGPELAAGRVYHLYDREAGSLQAQTACPKGFDVSYTIDWKPGIPFVLQIPVDGKNTAFIGYDPQSGLTHYLLLDQHGGRLEADVEAGTAGWTSVVPVPLDGTWYLLAHNRYTGRYRFGPFRTAPSRVKLDIWERGWSHIVAWPLGPTIEGGISSALLKYDTLTGDAEVDGVVEGGDGLVHLAKGNLGAGWTNIAAFSLDSTPSLLLYETNGRVMTVELPFDETMHFEAAQSAVWRGGITNILPVHIQGGAYALTHSVETGAAALMQLVPLESTSIVVK